MAYVAMQIHSADSPPRCSRADASQTEVSSGKCVEGLELDVRLVMKEEGRPVLGLLPPSVPSSRSSPRRHASHPHSARLLCNLV